MTENKLITRDEEIEKIIDNIFLAGSQLEVQQKDGDQIITNIIQVINVNIYTMDFAFRPLDPKKPLRFNERRPVTMRNLSGSISFKTSFRQDRNWNQLGFVNIPKILMLKNTRTSQRMNLEKFKLPVNFKNFTIFDYANKHLNISSEIIDLSKSGLSLKLDSSQVENFSTNDKIIFTLINGYSFSKKATGRLVYVSQVQTQKNDSFFKMGIKFENDSPYEQISKFIDNQIYIQT